MMSESISSTFEDFDWVTAKHECSIDYAFQQLRLQVESDVAKRNSQLPESQAKLGVFPAGTKQFTVRISVDRLAEVKEPNREVSFDCAGKQMTVTNCDGTLFTAGLVLSDEGHCRWEINAREYAFWQVRKKALEKCFFEAAVNTKSPQRIG